MSQSDLKALSPLIYSVEKNLFFIPNYPENEKIDIESCLIKNFSLDSKQKKVEPNSDIIPLNQNNSILSIEDQNPFPSLNEITQLFFGTKSKDSFSSSELSKLFISQENNSVLIKEEENFLEKKRSKIRRSRKYNRDDIYVKIKRGFFNGFLKNKLNNLLKIIGSRKYFENFPRHFCIDVSRKRNKEILNYTLREIFEKQELYIKENKKGWLNYLHNVKVMESEEIKKNEEIQKILNKTFHQLYEEYINSDEFKVNEINRLKRKNMKDDYIKRYKELANYFFQQFSY